MVELPQRPFGETIKVPDGRGGETVELDELVKDEDILDEVDDVDGEGVGVGVGLGVGVGVGVSGGASPHRPYWGWHPTSKPQCSNAVPHQP